MSGMPPRHLRVSRPSRNTRICASPTAKIVAQTILDLGLLSSVVCANSSADRFDHCRHFGVTPRGPKAVHADQKPLSKDSQHIVPPQAGEHQSSDTVSESYLGCSSTSAESKKNGQKDLHLADQVKGLMDDLSRVDISGDQNGASLTAESSRTLDDSRLAAENRE